MLTKIVVIFFIIIIGPLFCSRVETLKNLLSFAVFVSFTALLVGLVFSVQYLPIFMILVYVGAVVVASLFVALTLDLKLERNKNRYHPKFFTCIVSYFSISPILAILVINFESFFKLKSFTHSPLSVEQALARCHASNKYSAKFCNDAFISASKSSLVSIHNQVTSDLAVISTYFYTTNLVLFIVLTILLTASLFAGLAIVKKSRK